MTRRVIRVSYRDQLTANQKALDQYAAFSGKPRMEIEMPPPVKPRAPKDPLKESPVPLEADVQRAIIDGLRMHRMIGLVERVNSGSSVESNADGSKRYIEFHRVYAVNHVTLAAVDIHCTLKPSGKRFVVEVKRPGWKNPRSPRELAQAAYIAQVIACGGYGCFATSWDEVDTELRSIALCEASSSPVGVAVGEPRRSGQLSGMF